MIMKCCKRCGKGCSKRSAKETCQTEYLKVFGGASKRKNRIEIINEKIKNIYNGKNFYKELVKIICDSLDKPYETLIQNINDRIGKYVDIYKKPEELCYKILYIDILRELGSVGDKRIIIDHNDVINKVKQSKQNIISNLITEQESIKNNMDLFKTTFSGIDFENVSRDFLNTSNKYVVTMLMEYCKMEIALGDTNIIDKQLTLVWFAKNLIDSVPKEPHEKTDEDFHDKSEDDLHNEDDDDALLAYYVNELKGK